MYESSRSLRQRERQTRSAGRPLIASVERTQTSSLGQTRLLPRLRGCSEFAFPPVHDVPGTVPDDTTKLKDASQNPHLSVYAQGIHYRFAFRPPQSPEGISLESSMFW